MERDKKLESLIKENGIISAPEDFTEKVLSRIEQEKTNPGYEPILSRKILFGIFMGLVFLVILTFVLMDGKLGTGFFRMPDLKFLDTILSVHIPRGILAGILAMLILFISDAGIYFNRSGSTK